MPQLTRFPGEVDTISQLSDQPNDNDGLSADQLKAKFDQFAAEFKEFFNETSLPEIESGLSAAAAGIGPTGISGSILLDGSVTAEKLMGTSGREAVKTEVVRNKAITKPKLEQSVQDVLDSVSGKTTHLTASISLPAASWSNNQQTRTVAGVTSSNVVIATAGTDDTSHNAWSNNDIRVISQGTDTLTFKCRSVPSSNVNVNILILNHGG